MRFLLIIVITFLNIAYSDNDSTPLYSYKGGWPVNPKSNEIEDPGFDLPCPGGAGCECKTNKDCDNQNCQAHPKGNYCLPKKVILYQGSKPLINLGRVLISMILQIKEK